MDKRLEKRHKRKVARAKEGVGPSAPDVRTPEQVQAAKEAGRPAGGHGTLGNASSSAPSYRNARRPASGSSAKTDA